jgi:hypothetical protein
VAAGVYPERIILKAGISMYGGFAGSETERSQRIAARYGTILDGQAAGTVVTIPQGADNVTVDGFIIRNGKADGAGGIDAFGNNVTLTHNVITLNSGWGVSSYNYVLAAYNVISYNAGGGIGVSLGATIRGNLILGNTTAWMGAGISTGAFGKPVLEENTIVGNSGTDKYGGAVSFGPMGTFVNNVVAFNSSGVFYWDRFPSGGDIPYAAPSLDYNCLYGNTIHDYSAGDNDRTIDPALGSTVVQSDPLFVDGITGDYRLRTGSPCIDAGDDTAVVTGETDLNGIPRIQGAHVDLGACEWIRSVTMPDVACALRIAGGLSSGTQYDVERLGTGKALDLGVAARLARRAVGLDANP